MDQGWSLSHNSTFQQRVKRLNVDQGLLVYAKPPADIPAAYAQLESLHYLLAGLDISDSGFLTQAYASLDKDGSLTRALLSEPGTLSGDAARYIPKDWGFMASFHLGYVQRFISQLQKDEPGLAAPLVEAREEFESQIGVELGELLRVLEGEVSISSNGLRHAPLYYLGVDPTIDYKLTVTMPLKDPRAAQSLLKAAWSRLELDSEKLPDGAVLVSAAQLSYIVEQRLLIISYGPNSLKTLRECLVLRKGESLLSHPGVAGHYPLKSAVGSAYINLRPMIEELRHFDELGLVESLLFLDSDAIVEGTTELTVRSDGLMLEGTGGMPLFAGTGAAGAYLLFGIAPNSEASEVEIER